MNTPFNVDLKVPLIKCRIKQALDLHRKAYQLIACLCT